MIILKLGGSVVTDKGNPMTADHPAIRQLALEIAASGNRDLIVVHGGGSYGHPLASKYRIADGLKEESQVLGFSKTHNAMLELNKMIIDALIEQDIPAFPLSPSSFIVTENGRIKTLQSEAISLLLRAGLVPVLFGDAVLDSHRGCSVLSGDQLATRLATDLDASGLVFGVDVDGVYTSNPKLNQNATLIRHLSISGVESIAHIEGSTQTDITGGMLGKVREAIPAVNSGIRVIVLNAKRPGNILKILKGEEVIATILEM